MKFERFIACALLIASAGERGEAHRLAEIGFAGYLAKPVKRSLLLDCLLTVLGGAQAERTAPLRPLVTQHSLAEARQKQVRLLVVEDNRVNMQVALAMLRRNRLSVTPLTAAEFRVFEELGNRAE